MFRKALAVAALFAAFEANPGIYFEQVFNEVARSTYEAAQKQGGFLQIPGRVVGWVAPADCLAGKLAKADGPAAAPVGDSAPPPPTSPTESRPTSPEAPAEEVAPIDLMASAGPAVLKRLAPLALLLAVLVLVIVLRRRRG